MHLRGVALPIPEVRYRLPMKRYLWRVWKGTGRTPQVIAQGDTNEFMKAVTACNQYRMSHGSKGTLGYGIVDTIEGTLVWPVDKTQTKHKGKRETT